MSRKLIDGKHPKPRPGANKGGRPRMFELTPDLIEKCIAPLRIGLPITTAFALHNVSYATLRMWVLKGHEEPDGVYGALLKKIEKAIAEWEARDMSVIDMHATGRPAQYEMEIARDRKGNPVLDEKGKPIMQVARDGNGNPIIKSPAVQSDWRAAMERMARRKPKFYGRRDLIDVEAVLSFDNTQKATKETQSFEQKIAEAVERLEEDV